ncbi:GDSL esterase/lipase [Cardamine amara subsp. amara]|uniref:GDSL esterase/lipase n=1 Tax=Cardamine amara subsp. amara TaxID=228776 RepID=A0ABD1BPH7_CARAN
MLTVASIATVLGFLFIYYSILFSDGNRRINVFDYRFESGKRVTPPAPVAPSARGQQAQCYFVFGDSVFDNGNNNALNTIAKVNYLPYGIDFSQGPTGRFSNGRNIPDVIAELVGFNNYIPPFVGASPAQAHIGINYASGGGGIREDSSQNLGEKISLREQVDNHRSAILRAAVPRKQLKQCLYTINIGSNDYLNNYFLPLSPTRRRYTPNQYAKSLILLYRIYVKELHKLGARNVALFGIGKIGCTPRIIASLGGGTGCVEEVNQAADIFNNYLKVLVIDLNNNLFGAKFTYVDLFSGNAQDFAARGITVSGRSCCTVAAGEELCAANGPVCTNRTKYIFWDNVHTTEIVNAVAANKAFNGVNTSPYSISQLVN